MTTSSPITSTTARHRYVVLLPHGLIIHVSKSTQTLKVQPVAFCIPVPLLHGVDHHLRQKHARVAHAQLEHQDHLRTTKNALSFPWKSYELSLYWHIVLFTRDGATNKISRFMLVSVTVSRPNLSAEPGRSPSRAPLARPPRQTPAPSRRCWATPRAASHPAAPPRTRT